MGISPIELRRLPLFADITEDHLGELFAAFDKTEFADGDVLFEEGKVSDSFQLLVEGQVALLDEGEEVFLLEPPAPIGELGALTRLEREMTAVSRGNSVVMSISHEKLMNFFESHGDVAFPFHHNLLRIVAAKVRRDGRRLDEMRRNLISTQKSMKRMRDALLDSDDTPLHDMLFEQLDALIEQNKKGHYVVEPSSALPTRVRLDDGSYRQVTGLSNERVELACDGSPPSAGSAFSAVLVAPDLELPLSGTVEQVGDGRVVVDLDPLIDSFALPLEQHLTRLQMLDVVV